MLPGLPADLKDLERLLARGEGPQLEFKRSTGELREGLQTLCAFAAGHDPRSPGLRGLGPRGAHPSCCGNV